MIRRFMSAALMFAAMVFAFQPALAKPQNVRSGSKSSVSRPAPKAQNRAASGGNRSGSYNKPNKNNRPGGNNNRPGGNTNVKRGGHNNIGNTVVVAPNRRPPPPPRGGSYHGGGGYYYGDRDDWDDDNDFGEFVGKTIAVTAGVAIVGSILTDKPSNKDGSDCQQTISNGQVYMNCNGTWFQPVQMGNDVNYQTVNPPR